MTTGISGSGSRPHVPGLPHAAPTAVAQRLHAAREAEDALVADGLRQLGQDVPVRRHPIAPTEDWYLNAGERAATMPARRHAYVPVGTLVGSGPGDFHSWAVVGASGDDLHLARRLADGSATVQARVGWRELVDHSPELLDQPIRDARGVDWAVYSVDDVEWHGRAGYVNIAPVDELHAAAMDGREPTTVRTTWGGIVDAVGLDQRVPGVDMPRSEYGAINVRGAVGDVRHVVSDVGVPYGERGRLIGTDGRPGLAADVLRDADDMQRWYRSKVGIDVWGAGDEVLIRTDKREFLGNAAAAAIGDDAYLFEGPRDERLRSAWLASARGDGGQALRRTNEVIRKHEGAVRAHEATHVAARREWGGGQVHRIPDGTLMTAVLEDSIVEEAVGDAVGAAHDGRPTIGVRDLDRLAKGWGDYDQLQQLLATTPADEFDVHQATQLLTAPLAELQVRHGDDALAAITGAAIRDIGHRIAIGELTTVDMPTMAGALLDAAVWSHGADSELARGLETGWRALRVLR